MLPFILFPARSGWTVSKRWVGGYVLWQEGHYFHDRQLAVTYNHSGAVWHGQSAICRNQPSEYD